MIRPLAVHVRRIAYSVRIRCTGVTSAVPPMVLARTLTSSAPLRPDMPAFSEEGFSELHRAAFDGDVKRIRKIIDEGVSPNVVTHRLKITPLHLAVAHGRIEAVAELINTPGINVHATDADEDHFSPIFVAAKCGHKEILNLLLVEDPKVAVSPNIATINGVTLAHAAASCADHDAALSCMSLILERGAAVNVLDKMGLTPLHEAVRSQNKKLVTLLLSKGADPNLRELISAGGGASDGYDVTPIGVTALHLAAIFAENKDGIHIVTQLLEAGANPSVPDDLGTTPLHAAVAKRRNPEETVEELRFREAVTSFVVRELLKHKAAVNAAALNGDTALHDAAAHGWGEACFALLDHGANPTLTNKAGLTAADRAEKSGETEIADILRDVSRQFK